MTDVDISQEIPTRLVTVTLRPRDSADPPVMYALEYEGSLVDAPRSATRYDGMVAGYLQAGWAADLVINGRPTELQLTDCEVSFEYHASY